MSRHPVKPCGVTYPHLAHVGTHGDPASGRVARCRGVAIDPDTRAQPVKVRHAVVADLRSTKDTLQRLINRWHVDGLVSEGGRERPRRVHEYPENSADRWVELATIARRIAVRAHDLARFADDRARTVEAFNARAAERARRDGAVEL